MKYITYVLTIVFFLIGLGMSYIPTELFIETGSILAVSIMSLPAFYGLYKIYDKTAIRAIVALGIFALTIESIGIHTGFPYSHFHYINDFGYRLFETTPWTVAIAWSPLVISSYLLSRCRNPIHSYILFILILVGADLVLDPGAVARGMWIYENPGLWYGIPAQNFLGWIFSGTIAYGIMNYTLKKMQVHTKRDWVVGTLSLLLPVALWTGVCLGYQLLWPSILGCILTLWVFKTQNQQLNSTRNREKPLKNRI